MSLPPSSAAPPPPNCSFVDTFGVTWGDEYWPLIPVVSVIILYLILLHVLKAYVNESEPGTAAAEALPAAQERVSVQIGASVFSYREADGGHNDECAICLDGFKEGQKCRRMNKCGHIFHRSCIGRWLKVDCHCPLCRRCIYTVVRP